MLFGLLVIFSIINDFALYIVHTAEAKAMEKLKDKDPADDSQESHAPKIISSVVMILLCVFGGAIFFTFNEDWSFLDGFYYSFITTMVSICGFYLQTIHFIYAMLRYAVVCCSVCAVLCCAVLYNAVHDVLCCVGTCCAVQ